MEDKMKTISLRLRHWVAALSVLCFSVALYSATSQDARAIYLTQDAIHESSKIKMLDDLLATTEINAVVIDVKVDKPSTADPALKRIVERLNSQNVWTIARIVVMQDSWFAHHHPQYAIKTSAGQLWYSGKKSWHRWWVDPSAPEVVQYNIEIAKQAIDVGFREIQFDYIRFPSDGNLHDMVYPFYHGQNKCETMDDFFQRLTSALRNYHPGIVLGIDIFGEAYFNGQEPGIGQKLSVIEKYFDVICPMTYPSHYKCGEFGFSDPNAHPYEVMLKSLEWGKKHISPAHSVIIRPWIQDFSIPSIYHCGPSVHYGAQEVRSEIKAAQETGSSGFMLWNASNRYTKGALEPK